jgi:hypothetical protein
LCTGLQLKTTGSVLQSRHPQTHLHVLLSLVFCLLVFSTHHLAAVAFPTSPQEIFDWTGQRVFHPQMPIPRPFIQYTGKKRALIVCGLHAENHTLIILVGI